MERTLTGWEGRALPAISGASFDGRKTSVEDFKNKALLVYVWFTDCSRRVKIGLELVSLQRQYSGERFIVLGLNADRVLELEYDDADRVDYAKNIDVNYTNLHLTPEGGTLLGNVNISPTLLRVSAGVTILKQYVNFRSREVLVPAIENALSSCASE
jgi:hypothetical protein